MLFAIFASIFTDEYQTPDGATFTGASVYLAGMIAVALMSAGFLENVGTVTTERESGTLQRLYSSPMPRSAYLGGRIAMVVVNAALQVAALMIVATVFFDVQAPSDWLTFAWVIALGTAATASMGLAVSGLITSARAAVAIAKGFTNVLAFLSGCHIPTHDLPDWMITIGQVFPAYWIAHALRSTVLPEQYAMIEPAGEWQLGAAALVLAAWVIVGLLVASRTFRWAPSQPKQRRK